MGTLSLVCLWACLTGALAAYCPEDCFCREMNIMNLNRVYVVTRYYRNLTRVPNLAPLSEINIPIYVKLSYSNISIVTRDDFPVGLAVPFLNLGGNKRMDIHEDAFTNLRDSLLYLNLESSKIFFNTTLRFLKGLTKLETLILSFNNVLEYKIIAPNVKVGLFAGLQLNSLKKLKMYNCGIQTMDFSVLREVETVEELDLGANSLNEIPSAIEKLENLKILDMSNSYFIAVRTRTFVNNVHLDTLILTTSRVETIDADAFEGIEKSLQKLDLQNSNLSEVPSAALRKLQALKILKLDGSKIKSVSSNSFSGSYCLSDLSLGKMSFDLYEDIFKGQEQCIKNLFLRQRNLEDIPTEPLQTLLKLTHLFMNNNAIKELRPKAFSGVQANLLVLDGNPLSSIAKDAFTEAARPLRLSIEYTQVKSLSFCLEYPKGTFQFVGVTGLTITCDCTTARVIKLMEKDTLTGNCRNVDTGAGIGLQTDTVYNYLARKCPFVMISGSRTITMHCVMLLVMVVVGAVLK